MSSSFYRRASLSCSGRLSFNLLRSLFSLPPIKEANWSVRFYPSETCSLASCTTTFCLCKSCQRTLSSCPLPSGVCHRFSESECKGTAFSRHGKIFQGLFFEKCCFSWFRWWKSRFHALLLMFRAGYCEKQGVYAVEVFSPCPAFMPTVLLRCDSAISPNHTRWSSAPPPTLHRLCTDFGTEEERRMSEGITEVKRRNIEFT